MGGSVQGEVRGSNLTSRRDPTRESLPPIGDRTGETLPSIGDLSRGSLPSVVAGYLKRGAWNKADVLMAVTREGRWVVKDYGAKGWLVRAAGAMQLAREVRAYRALEGLAGVPRLGRRIDGSAIAVEFIEGLRLPKFHKYRPMPELADRLETLLGALHDRGVVHNDVRSRDNVLVTPAGGVYLIDFSSATTFAPAGLRRRFLMPLMVKAERRALLKWKSALAPERMTPEEWALHRRFGRLRRLWPFNPKEDLEVKRARIASEAGIEVGKARSDGEEGPERGHAPSADRGGPESRRARSAGKEAPEAGVSRPEGREAE